MSALVPLGETVAVDPQLAEVYARLYPLYLNLYNALQASFSELGNFSS